MQNLACLLKTEVSDDYVKTIQDALQVGQGMYATVCVATVW